MRGEYKYLQVATMALLSITDAIDGPLWWWWQASMCLLNLTYHPYFINHQCITFLVFLYLSLASGPNDYCLWQTPAAMMTRYHESFFAKPHLHQWKFLPSNGCYDLCLAIYFQMRCLSISSTYPSDSVGVTLSDFHCVGVCEHYMHKVEKFIKHMKKYMYLEKTVKYLRNYSWSRSASLMMHL